MEDMDTAKATTVQPEVTALLEAALTQAAITTSSPAHNISKEHPVEAIVSHLGRTSNSIKP